MKIFALFLVLLFVMVFAACGSSQPENANIDTVFEPGVTQPPPPDPNTIAANNPRDPKNKKPREIHPPGPASVPSEPRSAPEDSEMSAMMNEDGSITEIRVFKSHPQIARVEATFLDPRSKKVKVLLRNGQVREATTDKIPQLNEAKTDQILSVIGVRAGN